jgi:serine/threonine protein phosphatase PrpC
MQRIILSAATPQEACDNLVKAANAAGGDDNISVILVKVVVP